MSQSSRFRLAIEALGAKLGGAATVLVDVLDAIAADPHIDRMYVFCSPARYRKFSFPRSSKIQLIECERAESNPVRRLWWLQRTLASEMRRLNCDVLLTLSGCGLGSSNTPHLTFIQQSLPFFPEMIALQSLAVRLRLNVIRFAMKRSCLASRGVIVQTEYMKSTVSSAFSIEPGRILVSFPSTTPLPAPGGENSPNLAPMRAAARGSRLLYVGNHSPYKNLEILLPAARLMRSRIPDLSITLTLPLDHPLNGREGITCVGYLSQPELSEALSLADALVMPSLMETVGLPLLEAMTAGTPILVADRPYAREVCKTAALFFDPVDPLSLADSAARLLADKDLRDSLISEGLRLSAQREHAQPYQMIAHELVAAASRTLELSHV